MGSFSAPLVQLTLQSFRDNFFFAVPIVIFARQETAQLCGITCLYLFSEIILSRLVKRPFLAVFTVSFHPVYQINPIAITHFQAFLSLFGRGFSPLPFVLELLACLVFSHPAADAFNFDAASLAADVSANIFPMSLLTSGMLALKDIGNLNFAFIVVAFTLFFIKNYAVLFDNRRNLKYARCFIGLLAKMNFTAGDAEELAQLFIGNGADDLAQVHGLDDPNSALGRAFKREILDVMTDLRRDVLVCRFADDDCFFMNVSCHCDNHLSSVRLFLSTVDYIISDTGRKVNTFLASFYFLTIGRYAQKMRAFLHFQPPRRVA